MGGHDAMEVAKTVLEVADIAWTAVDCCHHHGNPHKDEESHDDQYLLDGDETKVLGRELESLRSENRHLRSLLEQNLKLLQNLSESPALLQDCPPDVCKLRVHFVFKENFASISWLFELSLLSGNDYVNECIGVVHEKKSKVQMMSWYFFFLLFGYGMGFNYQFRYAVFVGSSYF